MLQTMTRKLFQLTLFMLLCQTSIVQANTLEDISFSALPGDRLDIVLKTSEPIENPGSFSTDHPARIAVDLPNTTSALESKTKPIGVGVARSVTAIEARDRTRVVINLLSPVPHEIYTRDGNIVISLGVSEDQSLGVRTQPVVQMPSSPVTVDSPRRAAGAFSGRGVRLVDFRRGAEGEGRVEVHLTDPGIAVDMRQRGNNVVLYFADSSLAPSQAQTLDVVDFATPVTEIQTRPEGNSVRMEILAQGDYEHLAYQSDEIYTIEFRRLTRREKEEQKRREQVYSGERLSLNFQDIEVRAVLQLLADFTGLNMVVSDTVGGRITLRLKNVPWDQAMDIILKTKGLSMRRTGNVILVAPTEEIATRERAELEAQQQIEELAPLRSEWIRLSYASAQEIATFLDSSGDEAADLSFLSSRGSVTFDSRTNTLLIRDTAVNLEQIRELVQQLDIPVRQVLIESRIVIANNDFAKDIGVKFGVGVAGSRESTRYKVGGGLPGDIASPEVDTGFENPAGSGNQALLVNLPQTLAQGSGGAINFLIARANSYLLRLELTAMQQEGKGEIISSPRVVTSDQNQAIIKQGVEIPYQEASASGATSVSFKEAVLKLEVTPRITPDDRVLMDLKVNKDNPDFTRAVLGVPPVDTREVQTSVLVDNGETVVLGGVFERTTSRTVNRVPFFGELPYVGALFRQKFEQDDNSELLIFVTPKILKEGLSLR